MKSKWDRAARSGDNPPIEMRFIDMFMTALGSLVFIALLLVFLLPSTVEFFVSGTVIARDGSSLTVATSHGSRRIVLEAATIFRRHIPLPVLDTSVGEPVFAAGTARGNGSIRASIVETPLNSPVAELARNIFLTGTITSRTPDSATIETDKDGPRTVIFDDNTKYIRSLTAPEQRFGRGDRVAVAGRLKEGSTIVALTVQTEPEQDRISELEADNRRLRLENDQLMQINAQLKDEIRKLNEELSEQKNELAKLKALVDQSKTEDSTIQRRWLSVQIVANGCKVEDLYFYVRYEGKILGLDGAPRDDAVKFDASKIINTVASDMQLTLVGGDTYGVVKPHEIGDEVATFHTVARGQERFSVYAALRNTLLSKAQECSIIPVFYFWNKSPVLGERIVLTERHPFAWIRHFQINTNGTTNIDLVPREDAGFRKELEAFSSEQSQRLCEITNICGTIDAHLFSFQRAIVPSSSNVLFKTYDNFDVLSANLLQTLKNIEQQDCIESCQREPHCQAISYDKWNRWCFLKSSAEKLRLDARSVSAIRRGTDTSRLQRLDIPEQIMFYRGRAFPFGGEASSAASDTTACANRCRKAALCVAFTYFKGSRQCRLMTTTLGAFLPDAGADSGAKSQPSP